MKPVLGRKFFLFLLFGLIGNLLFAETPRERAERLLQQDINSISGNIAMGVALLDENDIEGAQKHLEKVITLKEDIPFVWYLLAMIYEKKNEKVQAIVAWEKVRQYSGMKDSEKSRRLKLLAEKHLKWLKEN